MSKFRESFFARQATLFNKHEHSDVDIVIRVADDGQGSSTTQRVEALPGHMTVLMSASEVWHARLARWRSSNTSAEARLLSAGQDTGQADPAPGCGQGAGPRALLAAGQDAQPVSSFTHGRPVSELLLKSAACSQEGEPLPPSTPARDDGGAAHVPLQDGAASTSLQGGQCASSPDQRPCLTLIVDSEEQVRLARDLVYYVYSSQLPEGLSAMELLGVMRLADQWGISGGIQAAMQRCGTVGDWGDAVMEAVLCVPDSVWVAEDFAPAHQRVHDYLQQELGDLEEAMATEASRARLEALPERGVLALLGDARTRVATENTACAVAEVWLRAHGALEGGSALAKALGALIRVTLLSPSCAAQAAHVWLGSAFGAAAFEALAYQAMPQQQRTAAKDGYSEHMPPAWMQGPRPPSARTFLQFEARWTAEDLKAVHGTGQTSRGAGSAWFGGSRWWAEAKWVDGALYMCLCGSGRLLVTWQFLNAQGQRHSGMSVTGHGWTRWLNTSTLPRVSDWPGPLAPYLDEGGGLRLTVHISGFS